MRELTEDRGVAEIVGSDVVDVSDLPLPELAFGDDTVLQDALGRLLIELDHPREIIAGWNSAPDDESSDVV